MRFLARAAVVAVTVGATLFALQTPSMADDSYFDWCSRSNVSCQTGTEVSGPSGADRCVTGTIGNTRICIKYDDDIVWVRDGSEDGHSALGRVVASSGVLSRYCRNPHGNGSWARCNFDWLEAGEKKVFGGVRISSSDYRANFLWSFING